MAMRATILIVDDDQQFRSVLSRLLEKNGEFRVGGEAGDGAEALELARALPPDIILMDFAMPGVNGFEATRRIKAERPETRIIIFTQYYEEASGERRPIAAPTPSSRRRPGWPSS